MERLKAGELLVRNPMNPRMVSQIRLLPDLIGCIVFWTKTPEPFMPYLDKMESLGFNRYYFHITLTPYGKDMEPNIPPKDAILDAFARLSQRIGTERVIWRYDPIILNDSYSIDYHLDQFQKYSETLSNYTTKCVMSFVDQYSYLSSDFEKHGIGELQIESIEKLIAGMSAIANSKSMTLASCFEAIDLEKYGIIRNRCIDGALIQRLFGVTTALNKDPAQRKGCLCTASRDIGAYNTCGHGCIYCYARRGKSLGKNQDMALPLLGPPLDGTERIIAAR